MRSNIILVLALVAVCTFLASACDGGGAESDAGPGVAVCSLTGATSSACDDPPPQLSAENCRCGSRYFWNGASCESTAACRCLAGCERLFETDAACEAAYATCRADGGP